jgi:hypothetical protein
MFQTTPPQQPVITIPANIQDTNKHFAHIPIFIGRKNDIAGLSFNIHSTTNQYFTFSGASLGSKEQAYVDSWGLYDATISVSKAEIDSLQDSLLCTLSFRWAYDTVGCALITIDSIIEHYLAGDCTPRSMLLPESFEVHVGTSSSCFASEVPLNKDDKDQGFTITPNPALREAAITSKSYEGNINVVLYDGVGKLITAQNTYISPRLSFQLPLEQLAHGMYTVSINGANIIPVTLSLIHQ